MIERFDTPAPIIDPAALEERGRWWLLGSFLLCPCHLPLSLGVLTTVLAGTSAGVVLREYAWVAGTLITAAWLLGTGYGLRLVRQAEKAGGSCPMPTRTSRTRRSSEPTSPR